MCLATASNSCWMAATACIGMAFQSWRLAQWMSSTPSWRSLSQSTSRPRNPFCCLSQGSQVCSSASSQACWASAGTWRRKCSTTATVQPIPCSSDPSRTSRSINTCKSSRRTSRWTCGWLSSCVSRSTDVPAVSVEIHPRKSWSIKGTYAVAAAQRHRTRCLPLGRWVQDPHSLWP